MSKTDYTTYRNCPICSNARADILHEINYQRAEYQILPLQYLIVSCTDCGFIYDDFNTGASVFEQHYARQNKYILEITAGAGGFSESDLIRYQQTTDFLEQHIKEKSIHVIDSGCGKGGLLQLLKQRGFSNVSGIEISPGCASYAEKQLKTKVYCTDLLKTKQNFPDLPPVDLLILSNVMEHIYDLKQTVRIIKKILAENGMLYIEVPDASRYYQYTKSPFYYFDFEHINHFDTIHLDLLLHPFGFKTCRYFETESYPVKTMPYPMCGGLYKLDSGKLKLSHNVKQYIDDSILREKNRDLPYLDSPHVFVWGLGAYFESLRYKKILNQYQIKGFIDINKQKTGEMIDGIAVSTPDILMNFNSENTLVLVTSVLYAPQIIQELEAMKWKGRIVDFT